jgi:hypothetical protein
MSHSSFGLLGNLIRPTINRSYVACHIKNRAACISAATRCNPFGSRLGLGLTYNHGFTAPDRIAVAESTLATK